MVLVPTFYISKNILCSIITNDKNETIFINSLLSKMKNLLCVYFHLLLLLYAAKNTAEVRKKGIFKETNNDLPLLT